MKAEDTDFIAAHAEGLSLDAMAERFQMTKGSVRRRLRGRVKFNFRIKRLAITDENISTLYQSGLGIKKIAKLAGTSHTVIRRRIIASCGIERGRVSRNTGPRAGTIEGKSVSRSMDEAWEDEWKSERKRDETRHWGSLWFGSPQYNRIKHAAQRRLRTNYYLTRILRTRTYNVLKGNTKSAPTLTMLGCSIAEFREHMERQFKRRMTWDNYGTHWHIDHILPCSSFDLSDPTQQRICFHFTNMQPLEATRNRKKHDKITEPQMKLHI